MIKIQKEDIANLRQDWEKAREDGVGVCTTGDSLLEALEQAFAELKAIREPARLWNTAMKGTRRIEALKKAGKLGK